MRMLRWVLVGAGVLTMGCGVAWWCLGGASPKLTAVECGFPGLCGRRLHTLAEQHPGKVVVHRVKPDGTVQRLGEHPTPERATVQVIGGVGAYYGVSISSSYWGGLGLDDAVRVYEAGRELYAVPRHLMSWGTRAIRPRAVLANGSLFVSYDLPGAPTAPPPHPNPPLLRLITHGPDGVRSHDLVATPTDAPRIAFAGDGSVAAVALGDPPSPAGIACNTVVYSAADGKVLRTIEKFAVSWISHDGRRMLGHKTNAVAIYQDSECIVEKATSGIASVRPCADGRYATLTRKGSPIEVLDMKSLEPVGRFPLTMGYEVADHALSCDGRLAVFEYMRVPGQRGESKLVVHQLDGKVLHTEDFGATKGWAVRSPSWFAGGKVLLYLNDTMTRIVRLTP